VPSRHTSTFDDRPHRRPGQPPASIDTSYTAFAVQLHTWGHGAGHDARSRGTGSRTGSPFRKLLELRKGDEVIVETVDAVYTYELDGSPRDLTVKPEDNWVLEPVPGKPQETPTKSIITLTTCQDLFHSPDRSVAFGHLVKVSKKA
jgi:LPXTG-site transpeptidase (sortase) family protein